MLRRARILTKLRFKPDEEIGPSMLPFGGLKALSEVEGLRVVGPSALLRTVSLSNGRSNEPFGIFEIASK